MSRGVLGAGRGLILGVANIGIFILAWRKSGAKDNAETLRRRGYAEAEKDLTQRARRSDTEFAEKGFLQRLKPGLWLAPTRGAEAPAS